MANGAMSERRAAAYDYKDEAGALLYQVVRFEPKDFRQRRPDGRGGWTWKLDGALRVLYRLPELKGRDAVLIVEGEKDVDRAWSLGFPATCNAGGASKSAEHPKWLEDYTQQLVAAGIVRVVVVPDNDEPGRAHAEHIARSCQGAGLHVRLVTLPDVPPKGDLSDYLASHGKSELLAVLKTAAVYEPSRVPVATVGGGGRDDDDNETVPSDTGWPAPLSRAAYYGIFGAIVDTLAPQTEADPAAILVQTLAMCGNVIGRTAHFRVEADTHHLNLFLVLRRRAEPAGRPRAMRTNRPLRAPSATGDVIAWEPPQEPAAIICSARTPGVGFRSPQRIRRPHGPPGSVIDRIPSAPTPST
jgi:hypothetical protein